MIVSNKYKDPEYFCNLPGNIKSRSLSIFHHNVCSLSKNFDQLHALLTKLDIDFDFIGITKSCISKTNFSPTNIALASYVIEQAPTESNAGRGGELSCTLIEKIHIVKQGNYGTVKMMG